jgi:hypothetical protein
MVRTEPGQDAAVGRTDQPVAPTTIEEQPVEILASPPTAVASDDDLFEYYMSGVWDGNCPNEPSGQFENPRGFDLFVESDGSITGMFYDNDMGWLPGYVDLSGQYSEPGRLSIDVGVEGGGRFEMVGSVAVRDLSFMSGTGTFRLQAGSIACSGTWTGE